MKKTGLETSGEHFKPKGIGIFQSARNDEVDGGGRVEWVGDESG